MKGIGIFIISMNTLGAILLLIASCMVLYIGIFNIGLLFLLAAIVKMYMVKFWYNEFKHEEEIDILA